MSGSGIPYGRGPYGRGPWPAYVVSEAGAIAGVATRVAVRGTVQREGLAIGLSASMVMVAGGPVWGAIDEPCSPWTIIAQSGDRPPANSAGGMFPSEAS
jgi:hypothetical protein